MCLSLQVQDGQQDPAEPVADASQAVGVGLYTNILYVIVVYLVIIYL